MPYSVADVKARTFLCRMLLVAPPKSGKTTCAVMTSPGPCYVLNSDGKGALDPVALMGGDFIAEDCNSIDSYDRALKWGKANKDKFATIILDNISTLSEAFEGELKKSGQYNDGRQLYPELKNRVMYVINSLLAMPHHVVVIGHVDSDNNMKAGFGHILNIAGKAKITIPAMLQDWIWLNVSVNPETKEVSREFYLAPQGNWTKGVRSLKDVTTMDADISKFIEMVNSRYDEKVPEQEEIEPEQETRKSKKHKSTE
jgi:hypothetical protein